MEEEKKAEATWEQIKTWLQDHQHWLSWPFRKIFELWNYTWEVIDHGTAQERALLIMVVLAIGMVAYVLFILVLREVFIRMPGFNRVPYGLPQSDDYFVQPTGYDRPMEFEWRYPVVWVGGTEFSLHKALLDKDDPLKFYLNTGTEVKFVPKPHKTRSK